MARDYGPSVSPNPGRAIGLAPGARGGRNGAPRWTRSSQHNLADLGTWEEVEYELVYTKMDPH